MWYRRAKEVIIPIEMSMVGKAANSTEQKRVT